MTGYPTDPVELRDWLGSTFFSVTFSKRTKPEVRVLRGRCGVTTYLKGGKRAYDAAQRGLIVVWDLAKRDYRSVPVDGIIELRAHGKKFAGPLMDLFLTAEHLRLANGEEASGLGRNRVLRGS